MTTGYIGVTPVVLYLLGLLALLFTVGVAYNVSVSRQLSSLVKRHKNMLQMVGSADLDAVVDHLATRVERVESKLDSIAQAYAMMAEDELCHVRTVAVTRFNAFERQGGDQSFSIALLDARGNGAVVTSLYGSQENRIYAKLVVSGKSEVPLSSEEQSVLSQASK